MNVISCSRRTDIPRCFAPWLEERLAEGAVEFRAPRGAFRKVSLQTDDIHSIVFWSKDYAPMLKRPVLVARLRRLNPYFHLTVTGLGGTVWEPDIPPWRQVAAQAAELTSVFGPGRVNWRFDPVLHWRAGQTLRSNLDSFNVIGSVFAAAGVGSCTFSFTQWYIKSRRRAGKDGLSFEEPPLEEKMLAAGWLAEAAAELGLELASCADETWTQIPGISRGRCIDAGSQSARKSVFCSQS